MLAETTFSQARVKAYRAYFMECRQAAKGTSEFNDLDVMVKLCDQLTALMAERSPEAVRKPGRPPASASTAKE